MWWVIHMCRGFDPLFSLWQDRARSFWGIFLIHQQQSYLLGYKNYQFLQKSIFLAPNSIFSSIFLGPIFSGQRHTPISFQAEYPPPTTGGAVMCVLPIFGNADLIGWVVMAATDVLELCKRCNRLSPTAVLNSSHMAKMLSATKRIYRMR